jgi:hypothetical protein
MADDQIQQEEVQEEEIQQEPLTEEAPVEEPQEEQPSVETEQPAEEPPAEEQEERPMSRREQLRVADLLKKYGPPQTDAPLKSDAPNFRDQINADEEVYKTLEETTNQFGQQQYNQGLSQARLLQWETLLKVDDPQVRTQFPQLNPQDKEHFHPALADAMNQKYLQFVGYDPGDPQRGVPPTVQRPGIRYLDFVEAEFEFADELASERQQRTTENIARQAAQTGLRPDGSQAKRLNLNKSAEEMTDEELAAAIDSTMPRDAKGRFTSR